jgi:hypothetical protein
MMDRAANQDTAADDKGYRLSIAERLVLSSITALDDKRSSSVRCIVPKATAQRCSTEQQPQMPIENLSARFFEPRRWMHSVRSLGCGIPPSIRSIQEKARRAIDRVSGKL